METALPSDRTMQDFASTLDRLGLSQAEFRRFIERLSGRRLSPTTTYRWAHRKRETPAEVIALLRLIEHDPRLLKAHPPASPSETTAEPSPA